MRDGNRILFAAAVALAAGVLAYADPASGFFKNTQKDEVAASNSFHAFTSACPLEWDQAPVARAMLSITQ